MDCPTYHIPVMLNECLEGLNIKADGIYVDLTFGGGGHSLKIAHQLSSKGHLYGFDQDMDAMKGAQKSINNIPELRERMTFVHSNFRFIRNWMRFYGVCGVDGILADLGMSSHHLDEAGRGFSFRHNAPLDMRMNQESDLTAKKVVMEYEEKQLANILHMYGELKQSKKIASAIVKARQSREIGTTGELASLAAPLLGRERKNKEMAKLFQALRIEVNGEMEALKEMLDAATEILKPGGRLVIMAYHSLEDRIVKNHIKNGFSLNQPADNEERISNEIIFGKSRGILKDVSRGVKTPSDKELAENPRSRSAKLRIAEKR